MQRVTRSNVTRSNVTHVMSRCAVVASAEAGVRAGGPLQESHDEQRATRQREAEAEVTSSPYT